MEREVRIRAYSGRNGQPRPPAPRQGRPASVSSRQEDKTAAKKRRRRRKHRHGSPILLYIMLIIIAAGAAVILCRTVFFGAETIEVQGQNVYSAEQIVSVSGLVPGDNIFSAKTSDIPARLAEQLPYIKSASISRSLFPAKFIIHVEETAAKYVSEDGAVLLDGDFKILDTNAGDTDKTDLTVIKGMGLVSPQSGQASSFENENTEEVLRRLTGALDAFGLTGITKIDISDHMNILMLYEDRILVLAGSTAEIDYKMTFAKRMLTQEISPSQEGRLDLSWLVSGKSTVYYAQGSLELFEPEYSRIMSENSG